MTDVSLELINQRAHLAAVRAEAERIGADPDALLDSKRFHGQVTALDPDAPGYPQQVRELVADATRKSAAQTAAHDSPRATRPPSVTGQRQWTVEEAKAVAKSDPAALQKAINDGLLTSLGYYPSNRRGDGAA